MAGTWEDSLAVLQQDEELQVLYKTIDSFYQYRRQSHFNITHRRRQNFYALPLEHREILAAEPFNFQARLDEVDDAIDANAKIADHIMMHALRTFDLEGQDGVQGHEMWQSTCDVNDLTKASTIINQFYRDWSAEGAVEREAHYAPVLRDLERIFADIPDRSNLKILVPGAGLARLVFDICLAGYNVEGNEISYHALLASGWVLNSLLPEDRFALHPFVSRFSNQLEFAQQVKRVIIPDVHVSTELRSAGERPGSRSGGSLCMSASDFLTAYQQSEHESLYDAVVTVFFIDTAPNLLRYIETISCTLRTGGKWINLGPLLWHFEDKSLPPTREEGQPTVNGASHSAPGIEEPGSIELTVEDVLNLVRRMGFEIDSMDMETGNRVPAGYIEQSTSMLQSMYRTLHFVATKL